MKGGIKMLLKQLTYGNEGIQEISKFLNDNYQEGYSLSIYNILEQDTIEVICDFDSMVDVILYIVNVEHDFPIWIGVNELSDSYVVGLNFTRGRFHTPSVCEWKDGRLIEKNDK